MATEWYKPQTISQYPEEGADTVHIQWNDVNGFSGLKSSNSTYVGTLGALYHIARSPKPNITTKTYYLQLTDFRIQNVPEVVSGVEVQIESRRNGRITDDTVSLVYNGEIVGENRGTLDVSPLKLYGSEVDNWGFINLTKNIVTDKSFGVVLRFKSHPQWPHNDPMNLVSVQLRIY